MTELTTDDGDDDVLLFTGYNDAVIGRSCVWNVDGTRIDRAVYSGMKLISQLMSEGMDWDEAQEWIDFNMAGAYVGPQTPLIVWPVDSSMEYSFDDE